VSTPHDAPDAAELIAAVREWIERDLLTSEDARLRFHSRVGINILAMVEREIVLAPGHSEAHRRRLEQLGVRDDRELAAKIRAGEFGDRAKELRDVLREMIDDKLAVANPNYLVD
jgi:Domain of unknown function (DUF6285)